MTNRLSDKILFNFFTLFLIIVLISLISISAGAVDIPEKVCASGAVENNSTSLYIRGSIGQPIVQNCNSVSLYMKSGFIKKYSAVSDEQCYPGDANNDDNINILDVVYLINFKYKGGPPPVPDEICSGDSDCDCVVNILDAVLLINYKYKSGLPPCTYNVWRSNCD